MQFSELSTTQLASTHSNESCILCIIFSTEFAVWPSQPGGLQHRGWWARTRGAEEDCGGEKKRVSCQSVLLAKETKPASV